MMLRVKEISWWYWLITLGFLIFGVLGNESGFYLAIGAVLVQIIHFGIEDKSFTSFSLQIRYAMLALLLLALTPPLHFLYWIPVVGLSVMLTTGYCFLARCLSLLPWVRKEPMTSSLLRRTFFTPPVKGCILNHLPPKSNS